MLTQLSIVASIENISQDSWMFFSLLMVVVAAVLVLYIVKRCRKAQGGHSFSWEEDPLELLTNLAKVREQEKPKHVHKHHRKHIKHVKPRSASPTAVIGNGGEGGEPVHRKSSLRGPHFAAGPVDDDQGGVEMAAAGSSTRYASSVWCIIPCLQC